MDERDIKSLINATASKMPDVEPDRRELLKRQAQQLSAMQPCVHYPSPTIDMAAERRYLDAQVLLFEMRKRKRDEGF